MGVLAKGRPVGAWSGRMAADQRLGDPGVGRAVCCPAKNRRFGA